MSTRSNSWKYIITSLLLCCITFYSCKKNDSVGGETPPDLVSRVSASANGYVTNELNQPVQGATVKMGAFTTTTDEFGFFEIINAQVVKNAAVITVQQPGYFNAIKTFAVESGRKHQTRIQLIPRVVIGSIDAATGGVASDANGMKVELPAAGVVNATTGAAYTGTVQVAAHWIDPSSSALTATMPGDLRALNSEGLMRTLITYGMIKVELTGSGGEKLQIANGKKSKLTFPLPATMSGSAPASIPLWYFDEDKGLWVEEGAATRVGNTYEGEVSHFSYWNCDIPANFVHFNVTVIDANGNPVPMAHVRIRSQSNPYNSGVGYTDSTGYTSGYIPANSDLVIEVSFYNSCGTPSYTQNFSTTNANLSLGTITLPAAATATASGTLTDCNGQPVTNGYVVVQYNAGPVFRYPVDATGAYQFSTPLCGTNAVVNIVGVDLSSQQQSSGLTYTMISGANNIGNIQACGIATNEFIHFVIDNGTPRVFTPAADSIYTNLNSGPSQQVTIGGFRLSGTDGVQFIFDWDNIGINTQQALYQIESTLTQDPLIIASAFDVVNITEFGSLGEFVAGNFTITYTASNNIDYTISCTFRIRRRF
jgi:hypothetical protein